MRLIKLDAIDSTNDFLKKLSANESLENFTVVTAENQTKGKGQMGAVWNSETGKNLIVSVLVKNFIADVQHIFNLNIAFSVAAIETLQALNIPELSIKWPNDILSGNKKIGGILIENNFGADRKVTSVAGLGLNVNQTSFENLPKASSLSLICNQTFDKDVLLESIMERFESNIENWPVVAHLLKAKYVASLFKKDRPMPFQNQHGKQFMGIIRGISNSGKLQVQLEDDSISTFDIKEIQMLY